MARSYITARNAEGGVGAGHAREKKMILDLGTALALSVIFKENERPGRCSGRWKYELCNRLITGAHPEIGKFVRDRGARKI
jgi:hypothetical protein